MVEQRLTEVTRHALDPPAPAWHWQEGFEVV